MPSKAASFLTSCAMFLIIVVLLCLNPAALFVDSDTAWHMAAGDLIRSTHNITPPNTWSFTAPDHVWINLSWLWDLGLSLLHEKLGWYGPALFNSMTIALTMVVLYHACRLRSENGLAAFFTVLLILLSIMLHTRSLWMSNLFLALLLWLALLMRHRGWSARWWYAMPFLMPLWVNLHGGFIVAFFLLGAFGLEALIARDFRRAGHMALAGVLSIAGLAASPFGIAQALGTVFGIFDNLNLRFIGEFQPTAFNMKFWFAQSYVPVFLYCILCYRPRGTLAENFMAYVLFALSLSCIRYWNFFYLLSAPLLAQYIAGAMGKSRAGGGVPQVKLFAARLYHYFFVRHARPLCGATALFFAAALLLLASPTGGRFFGLQDFNPYRAYEPGIRFAMEHYPHTRFLADYGLAAQMLYLSGGTLPVFFDGRAGSAYPPAVVEDFYRLWKGDPFSETLLRHYRIDGAIVYAMFAERELGRRFIGNPEWKEVFRDPHVIIFVRR